MAIDVIITTNRIASDPIAREFIAHVRANTTALHLDGSILYYDFPVFADYETATHKPDALLASPKHGLVAIRFLTEAEGKSASVESLSSLSESLNQFTSILIGRLLKSRPLRSNRAALKFPVVPAVITVAKLSALQKNALGECEICTSFAGFDELLGKNNTAPITRDELAELRSVIEGAKALTRPQRRIVDDPEKHPLAAALQKLESDIANFDERQRHAALINVPGPQRIRGLAGSGKTVILAMKAAHLHLTQPEQKILVTFYTRSLRSTLKNLITRFYRHYKDEDPDWEQIHIRHGWGGANTTGVYSDACRRVGITPMSFTTAQQSAQGKSEPFEYACRSLVSTKKIQSYYDYVLIDEGQDFPAGFYELCFFLVKGERDSKNIVWAYDELQNIMNVNIRSASELFGQDTDGEPRISLERSGVGLPPGATNDTVLSKCYRNQREVLVTAHALGFGIYDQIVQLLESQEHWQDVGYEIMSGNFKVGSPIRIFRPPENSPMEIEAVAKTRLVDHRSAKNLEEEIGWVTSEIQSFLEAGLQPEDILVIILDDRHSRTYLRELSSALAAMDIKTNNILADPYTEPPFSMPGKVTLSTVYRAKGNEASVVFALGVDAIPRKTRLGRNKLFTAFTRTKAWLRVSGLDQLARNIFKEMDKAHEHFPYLDFVMPDLAQIETIQRDLSKRTAKVRRIREEYIKRLQKEGVSEDEIADLLAIEAKDAKA